MMNFESPRLASKRASQCYFRRRAEFNATTATGTGRGGNSFQHSFIQLGVIAQEVVSEERCGEGFEEKEEVEGRKGGFAGAAVPRLITSSAA